MKRFVETDDWYDPVFRTLSPKAKHLRRFLWDNCDRAGVIALDLEAISFHVGERIEEKHLSELKNWFHRLPDGKLLIPTFVVFQCGELKDSCLAHRPVIKMVELHSLVRVGQLYVHSSHSLCGNEQHSLCGNIPHRHKEEETEEEEYKETEKEESCYSPESRVALHYLNEKAGRSFRECESSLSPINARLKEAGVDIDGVRKMIDRQVSMWKGDPLMDGYLRPETLFSKGKFDGYYGAKDCPVNHTKPAVESKQLQETITIRKL